MAIKTAASESFTIRILPYVEANVKARLLSRVYNRSGPVITMKPRIVIATIVNRGIIIDMVDALTTSLDNCLSFGIKTNAI